MIVIDLLTYPMLAFWRRWLGSRGLGAWYLVEVVGLWGGTTLVLVLLAPWWLGWRWDGALPLQVLGGLVLVVSIGVGTWAVAKMGWARLLFAGALFPPGAGAEENRVPQRLVVEGPYRYVRNPLYVTDLALILSAASLPRAGHSSCSPRCTWRSLGSRFRSKSASSAAGSGNRTGATAGSSPASCRGSRPCDRRI